MYKIFEIFIPITPRPWKVIRGKYSFYNVNQFYIDHVRKIIAHEFKQNPSCKPIKISFVHILPYTKIQLNQLKKNPDHKTLQHIKRPDVTNLNKQMEDVMTGIVYADDRQVVEISGKKIYGLDQGTKIEVYEIN